MKNVILITGATGAIGGAAAREIIKRGQNDLILLGRNITNLQKLKSDLSALNAERKIEIVDADLNSVKSVRNAEKVIRSITDAIYGILNVAAVYKNKRELNADGLETMFMTNHLGHFQLTLGLLDTVKRTKGRIVTVSAPSTVKLNFDDLQGEKEFAPMNKFGASKMANLLFTFALSRRLAGTGAIALAYSPGIVKSDLTKEMPLFIRFILKFIVRKPDRAGYSLAELMLAPEYENLNGGFFDQNEKELKRPGYSGNTEIQDRLWTTSEELIARATL